MKTDIVVMFISLTFLLGCNDNVDVVTIPVPITLQTTSVSLACIDHVSIGGRLNKAIRTQAEYDSLIYQYYQKRLDDYWNANYQSILHEVMVEYPGLSDSEYAVLVRNVFYSALPFAGTENCSFPSIDFTQNTLLVQSVSTGGCRGPDITVNVIRNDARKEIVYSSRVVTHGNCAMAYFVRKWLLVTKIPESDSVIFTQQEIDGGE